MPRHSIPDILRMLNELSESDRTLTLSIIRAQFDESNAAEAGRIMTHLSPEGHDKALQIVSGYGNMGSDQKHLRQTLAQDFGLDESAAPAVEPANEPEPVAAPAATVN